ncbi:divalent-cation tolerance protein CutA [Halosimplex aquaticum]|uniref:Divalent-cation tolerance protein CutA n=1 Tax=Halosimplex aquaticum TaxID=3026162 RepID=A0ABD5XZ31_9EURY|nr:divalent cation tolerance protein CutA [Halosimplex aquaticum]
MSYLAVRIGVPDETAAHQLSRALVEERIAAGTRMSAGTSHYWWDGEVNERRYWTITAFTTSEQLELLYDLVDEGHPDELPGVTYTEIDARDEFLAWIDDQTR